MERLFSKSYGWLNRHLENQVVWVMPLWLSPNMVTIFRTILVVPIVMLVLYGYMAAAITMFVFAGILDYVDGALARGRNEVSELGKFLDPISDKIFFSAIALPLSIGLFTLSPNDFRAIIILVLCLISSASEMTLSIVRTRDFIHNRSGAQNKRELKATYAGKFKFDLQAIGLGALVVAYPNPVHPLIWVGIATLALSLPFACLSIAHKHRQPIESR
ncbi:MAG: CDP-alcohol phosphatidyltransferase family protein [Candidatus Magasanikbacteria bacterium]|nr:CDP-alcohol phosphatidyltransferase family protein [Candidatus Magasanikbacteria bacterium]